MTRHGEKRLKKTNIGWKLMIRWMDGLESWIYLKGMKELHLIEVAEFSKSRGIADEPDF